MARPKVFATDTNIIMQKSKFVYGDLRRSDGHESGVIYGTIGSVARLIKRFKPDYFIPVFDYGKSDHRKEIDGAYKANRGPKDTPLINQFAAIRGLFEELGFNPYFEKNVEADDLLAKLAFQYTKDKDLVIVTQDHDMFQLIDKNVMVYRPKMGRRGEQFLDLETARIEFGIEPNRLAEVWAITGDAGDNVPGVRGYGGVKALRAVNEHGSLNAALANDPKLLPFAEQCMSAYSLIKLDGTVATEEPSFVKYKDVLKNIYGKETVMEFLEMWGMKSYLNQYVEETLFTP